MKRYTKFSYLLMFFLFAIAIFYRFKVEFKNPIQWDFYGYYMYLPAFLNYDDIGMEDKSWVNENNKKYSNTKTYYQFYKNKKTGRTLIKYPVGQAIAYSPFYLLADQYAKYSKYDRDGFSEPYQVSTLVASYFYVFLGFILMYLLFSKFFNPKYTFLILLIIGLGTNYFRLLTYNPILVHNVQLVWYAAFLLICYKWHKSYKKTYALLLGMFYGLAVITRPTAVLLIIIPIFWGVNSFAELKNKIGFVFKEKYTHLILLIVGFMIFASVQMMYWKHITGSWISYTYQNNGEGFDLLKPHTLKFLFSFRKGWVIYTPAIILAFAGFYTIKKTHKNLFLPFLIFSVFYIWLVSSWTCWWYAESFSQRSILESYPLFGILTGSFLLYIKKFKIKYVIYSLIPLFIILNLFQSWQIEKGIIHGSRMTKEYYFKTFAKTKKPENIDNLLLISRSKDINGIKNIIKNEKLKGPEILSILDFENKENKNVTDTIGFKSNKSFLLNSEKRFSNPQNFIYQNISSHYFSVFKTSVYIYPLEKITSKDIVIASMMKHKGDHYAYRTSELYYKDSIFIVNQWNKLELYYITPHIRDRKNEFSTYLWNITGKDILIDNFKVKAFTKQKSSE